MHNNRSKVSFNLALWSQSITHNPIWLFDDLLIIFTKAALFLSVTAGRQLGPYNSLLYFRQKDVNEMTNEKIHVQNKLLVGV